MKLSLTTVEQDTPNGDRTVRLVPVNAATCESIDDVFECSAMSNGEGLTKVTFSFEIKNPSGDPIDAESDIDPSQNNSL